MGESYDILIGNAIGIDKIMINGKCLIINELPSNYLIDGLTTTECNTTSGILIMINGKCLIINELPSNHLIDGLTKLRLTILLPMSFLSKKTYFN